jgi:hypothetical protein
MVLLPTLIVYILRALTIDTHTHSHTALTIYVYDTHTHGHTALTINVYDTHTHGHTALTVYVYDTHAHGHTALFVCLCLEWTRKLFLLCSAQVELQGSQQSSRRRNQRVHRRHPARRCLQG